ncbi:Imm17 family immunity protein [Tepidibacter mesophilus]|uniref:Imm17 family immunity protein n=1 Tax=Tepidibacter mesophilus TaxID=655607 RepID=UPI000C070672|nr:Imm17 family immunity protein [Tepidibacter mesophilus]
MSLLFILIGLYTIIATIKKPDFFWENRKAKFTRKIVGDKIASIFYMIIGCFISGVGVYLTFAG